MNLYAYVGNNPVNWLDSSGLSLIDDVLDFLEAWIQHRVSEQWGIPTSHKGRFFRNTAKNGTFKIVIDNHATPSG